MAEHVNGSAIFGSGGHAWMWGPRERTHKRLGTMSVEGEAVAVTSLGSRPVRIAGRNGGPALLTATGANQAAADGNLDTLEQAIEDLADAATECTWEDDTGASGTKLVIVDYVRVGLRRYSRAGTDWVVWQRYRVLAVELTGGW